MAQQRTAVKPASYTVILRTEMAHVGHSVEVTCFLRVVINRQVYSGVSVAVGPEEPVSSATVEAISSSGDDLWIKSLSWLQYENTTMLCTTYLVATGEVEEVGEALPTDFEAVATLVELGQAFVPQAPLVGIELNPGPVVVPWLTMEEYVSRGRRCRAEGMMIHPNTAHYRFKPTGQEKPVGVCSWCCLIVGAPARSVVHPSIPDGLADGEVEDAVVTPSSSHSRVLFRAGKTKKNASRDASLRSWVGACSEALAAPESLDDDRASIVSAPEYKEPSVSGHRVARSSPIPIPQDADCALPDEDSAEWDFFDPRSVFQRACETPLPLENDEEKRFFLTPGVPNRKDTEAKGPVDSGRHPRYQNSAPGPFHDEQTVPVVESQRVLDGRRMEADDCRSFAVAHEWEFIDVTTSRVIYDGEQRLVANRNVKETKQDVVIQKMRFTVCEPRAAVFFMILLWCVVPLTNLLEEFVNGKLAASISLCLIGSLGVAFRVLIKSRLHALIMNAVAAGFFCLLWPEYTWILELFLRSIGFIPWLLYFLHPTLRYGQHHKFSWFGVEWTCTNDIWWWVIAAILRIILWQGYAHAFTSILCVILLARAKTTVYHSLNQLLFPQSVKTMWVCPHAVSCAMAEYNNGTNGEVVVSTCRGKLMRLATLPLPDVMHCALVAGTEEVVKHLVTLEPFFEAGATFATSPL